MSNEKLFIKDLANLGEIDSFLDWHMQIELIAMYECYPNFEKGFNSLCPSMYVGPSLLCFTRSLPVMTT